MRLKQVCHMLKLYGVDNAVLSTCNAFEQVSAKGISGVLLLNDGAIQYYVTFNLFLTLYKT